MSASCWCHVSVMLIYIYIFLYTYYVIPSYGRPSFFLNQTFSMKYSPREEDDLCGDTLITVSNLLPNRPRTKPGQSCISPCPLCLCTYMYMYTKEVILQIFIFRYLILFLRSPQWDSKKYKKNITFGPHLVSVAHT